jgi:hypothetical protein
VDLPPAYSCSAAPATGCVEHAPAVGLLDHAGVRVVAANRAFDHPNLVHNDDYARNLGFQGGLVPGVDVYAYLTRPAIERFGREWLERGTGEVRFIRPVYDRDQLDIDAAHQVGGQLTIEGRCGGEVRAVLTAGYAPTRDSDDLGIIPESPVFEPKLRAVRQSFHVGMALGSLAVTLTKSECLSQLAEVSETLDFYRLEHIVHPGHLLRFADEVLSASVNLPPWLHVGSSVRHFDVVRWDESLSVRARVLATFVRKRNQFIQLDVLMLGVDGRPRVRVSPYTAIYKPFFGHA